MTQPIYTINGTDYLYLFGELHAFESGEAIAKVCGNPTRANFPGTPPAITWSINNASGMLMAPSGKVYLITNGHKYYLGSNGAIAYYQLNGAQQRIADVGGAMCFEALPEGEGIPEPPTAEAK